MKLPLLKNADVSGKTVFLRADLDVPLRELKTQSPIQSGTKLKTEIEDDTRLIAAIPTIEYLLKHNAKIIIAGHLGRPEGKNYESRIMNQEFSLRPIAEWFTNNPIIHPSADGLFMIQDATIGRFEGWQISDNLFLLDNLRFYNGEEGNDPEFAKKLASLANIYVNDAFAVSHRNHASIVGVPKYLPHFAGLRLQKEIEVLSKVLENPKRPLVVVIGGVKIETKLPLLEHMCKFADYVLVGGKIAQEAQSISKLQNQQRLIIGDQNQEKTDITVKSIDKFLEIIDVAEMIVWNGPVGLVQSSIPDSIGDKVQSYEEDTERGTRELAQGITKSKAYTIVGGGDTLGFLKKIGILDKFSFVSTGGGAMLSFLSKEKMPGINVLKTSNN